MELIFNLADAFKRFHSNGTIEIQPRTIIVGQTLRQTTIAPLGRIKLFGVRFQTAGAQMFFDFPLNELSDRIEAPETVLGATGKYLEERINLAASTKERLAVIENMIVERLALKNGFDFAMARAAKIIETANGLISVEELSKQVGIGSRHLERKFRQKIGLSPKSLCRIIRLQTLLNVLKTNRAKSWTELTMDFGYFDQAHLIRDFKQFTGKTPLTYLAENGRLTDIFTGL